MVKKGEAEGDGLVTGRRVGSASGRRAVRRLRSAMAMARKALMPATVRPGVETLMVSASSVAPKRTARIRATMPSGMPTRPIQSGFGLRWFEQVGQRDHGGECEAAIADEVGRHVDLHPPVLQRRHPGLDPRASRATVYQSRKPTALLTTSIT